MKKIIFIILLLPFFAFAQETRQWTRTLTNQKNTQHSNFQLPSLEDELYENFAKLSNKKGLRRYYQGIRFTIQPSFSEQKTYEFFYNYYENYESFEPEAKKRISEASDLEYILFRKYIISDASKILIEKSRNPSERPPDHLNIDVTDLFIRDFHQQLKLFQNRILHYFNEHPSGQSANVTDGVKYSFEVAFGFGGFCKVYMHSPKEDSEAFKLIKDMQNFINSLP